MKKKALISSILTIVICLSLIAGSTFALFTSESDVNIAVTAGKVEMEASIADIQLYSVKKADANTAATDIVTDENNKNYVYEGPLKTFTNGGTAVFDGSILTLEKVTPGDKVTFNITGKNTSDVAIQYRYIIECTNGYMLMSGLDVSVNGGKEYTSMASYTSVWNYLPVGSDMSAGVSIKLPVDAGNEYQGESTAIKVTVEAVQGNAVTENANTPDGIAVEYITKYTVGDVNSIVEALTSNDKHISVTLAKDIDLPIAALGTQNAGSDSVYKLGGPDTETINIDLNGHKLNLTTTYQSAIGAKNDNATIIIKDGSMNSTGNDSTVWNEYDIEFYNCNYVIENVTFDKSIALHSNTALKNVTINESKDLYALWITAEGQKVDIDGLTVNAGRGIKIDDQYPKVDPKTVTLNVIKADFNNLNKAAIVVKSSAGAVINLDSKYVDISDVINDKINAVWVDADASEYDALVTVNGGTKIIEPTASIDNVEDLKNVLSSDEEYITVSLKKDLDYYIKDNPALSMGGDKTKTIVINGNGHTINFKNYSDNNNFIDIAEGAQLVINNANLTNTIFGNNTWNSYDIIFACDVVLNNVTTDKAFAFKADATLNNVTIDNAKEADVYAIWIQANGQNVTIDGLTVNSNRGIKIDDEYITAEKVTLKVSNATFDTNKKAAIIVKSAAGADITLKNLDISHVTADSTNAVWVDEGASAYNNKITVIGGTKVQE